MTKEKLIASIKKTVDLMRPFHSLFGFINKCIKILLIFLYIVFACIFITPIGAVLLFCFFYFKSDKNYVIALTKFKHILNYVLILALVGSVITASILSFSEQKSIRKCIEQGKDRNHCEMLYEW